MSRAWARAGIDQVCGGCGASIAAGDPRCALTVPGVRRALVRCAACAGPAPALPPVVAPPPRVPVVADFVALRTTAFDWRRRAAADRED